MEKAADWLGLFVEDEIRHVLAWAREQQQGSGHVKPDPDCRFSDDHSNFRSVADSYLLPSNANVQIVQVVSVEGRVTAFVTDGFTKIKARLSKDVVRILEAEIDGEIDLETKGDVFALRNVTVESTPYGPYDGFIQLVIAEANYLHHRRKPLGRPEPVETRAGVIGLLHEIEALRQQQQGLVEDPEEPLLDPLSIKAPYSTQGDESNGADTRTVPQSQISRDVANQRSLAVGRTPMSQQAFATQITSRPRQTDATLARDGFEVKEGVNLDRPVPPTQASSSKGNGTVHREQIAAANGTVALLSLLGKRKAAQPMSNHKSPKARALSPVEIKQEPLVEDETEDIARDAMENSAPPAPSQINEFDSVDPDPPEFARRSVGPAEETVLESSHLHATDPVEDPSDAEGAAAKAVHSGAFESSVDEMAGHWRRPVPRDQRELLENDSSWLPSFPGRQFPRPNIPMQLLDRWNAKALEMKEQTPDDKGAPSATHGASQLRAERALEEGNAPDSSSSSSSREWEAGPSEWGSSPFSKTNRLPPDSTMESHKETTVTAKQKTTGLDQTMQTSSWPSTANGRIGAVPANSTNIAEIDFPNVQRSPPNAKAVGSTPFRTPNPLPNRPGWIQDTGARDTSVRRSAISNSDSSQERQRPDTRPSPSMVKAGISFMNPPSRPFKRPLESPQRDGTVVVRDTQSSPRSSQDLEMSVARPLERDPSASHRQKRSEYMRPLQRREWIVANCNPGRRTQSELQALYESYRNAWPIDKVEPSEFAKAVNEIYAGEEGGKPSMQNRQTGHRLAAADDVACDARSRHGKSGGFHGAFDRSSESRVSSNENIASVEVAAPRAVTAIDLVTDANMSQRASGRPKKDMKAHKALWNLLNSVEERQTNVTERATSQKDMGSRFERKDDEPRTGCFADFVRAWNGNRPGGAFASRRAQENIRLATTTLNVLAWNL